MIAEVKDFAVALGGHATENFLHHSARIVSDNRCYFTGKLQLPEFYSSLRMVREDGERCAARSIEHDVFFDTIAVNAYDTGGGGGFNGPAERVRLVDWVPAWMVIGTWILAVLAAGACNVVPCSDDSVCPPQTYCKVDVLGGERRCVQDCLISPQCGGEQLCDLRGRCVSPGGVLELNVDAPADNAELTAGRTADVTAVGAVRCLAITAEELRRDFAAVAARFDMSFEIWDARAPYRTLIMVSKHLHCLNDLLADWKRGELPMTPVAIVSNHQDMLAAANAHHLPYFHLPVDAHNKATQEAKLLHLVHEYRADLVIRLLDGASVLAIVVEVQLSRDERKRFAWPAYVANLRARRELPVCLLVVTADHATARWAATAIDLGGGNRYVHSDLYEFFERKRETCTSITLVCGSK